MPKDIIDTRLLDVEFELSDLNYYLDLLENQIKERQAEYQKELEQIIKEKSLTPDDSEWQIVNEYELLIDYRMPRFFRAPFLISLYAVYESAVIEIAKLFKKKKKLESSIKDQKGKGFLDKAKKYYKGILDFPLYSDKKAWDRITMLSDLRNAIAHANGRIEMIKKDADREKISNWERRNFGISSVDGYLVFEERFLRDTLSAVSASLNDLVDRYKEWDDQRRAQAGKPVPPIRIPSPLRGEG